MQVAEYLFIYEDKLNPLIPQYKQQTGNIKLISLVAYGPSKGDQFL